MRILHACCCAAVVVLSWGCGASPPETDSGSAAEALEPFRFLIDWRAGRPDHREEAAHDAQPPRGLMPYACRGPLDSDLRDRSVVAAPFEMLDEVAQQTRFGSHGEAGGATQRDVGLQVLSPRLAGHRAPPGHGRATVARVSRSSLA